MQDEECHERVVRGATFRYVDVWSDDGFVDDMNVDYWRQRLLQENQSNTTLARRALGSVRA